MEEDLPTIQEVLDVYFPGYIAEEAVLPDGTKINLEEKKDANNRKTEGQSI